MSKLDEYAADMATVTAPEYQTWKPEENDLIVGKFVEILDRTTDFGDGKLLQIENDDGITGIWCNGVLLGQLSARKVEKGDTIGIKCLGKVHAKKGDRSYKSYIVKVYERAGEEIPF